MSTLTAALCGAAHWFEEHRVAFVLLLISVSLDGLLATPTLGCPPLLVDPRYLGHRAADERAAPVYEYPWPVAMWPTRRAA